MYSWSFDKFYVIIVHAERTSTVAIAFKTLPLITCYYRLQDKKFFIFFCLEQKNSIAISCIGRFYHLFAP